MNRNIVVAVDGPAGSGKSSVCRQVAVDLGLKYIDSGALYRSVTLHAIRTADAAEKGFSYSDEIARLAITQQFLPSGACRTFLDGRDVTEDVRDEAVTRCIGAVSDDRRVRDFVNTLLRTWARNESIIMDGRDIGTVVFPDADLKIYIDASVDVRTERRLREYRELGKNVDENQIKNQIIQRDQQDRSRPYGALVQAADAVYLDTTSMDMPMVIAAVKDLILRTWQDAAPR